MDQGSATACESKQRYVRAGTPILKGPGIGYPVDIIVEKNGCFSVLQGTKDGRFLLLKISEESVGWINTGLVDSKLNQRGVAESPEGIEPSTLFAVTQIILREKPRFDSPGIGKPIPDGSPLEMKAVSADKQWYRVRFENNEGWVLKYQTAVAPIEPGKAPSAGAGRWASTRAGRRTIEQSQRIEALAADKDNSTDQPASAENSALPAIDPLPQEQEAVTANGPMVGAGPVLGRTQEIRVGGGYSLWQQNYRSDALNTAFHKYNLIAPLGGDLGIGYGFRSDFPLVVDVDLQAGMTGFQGAVDEVTSTTVLAGHLSPSAKLGWRLFTGSEVDVEAGLRANIDVMWVYSLDSDDFRTALTGYYLGSGPWLSARSRLSGGSMGMIIFEGAVPIAAYGMSPDPYVLYEDARNAGEAEIVYEDLVAADYSDNNEVPERIEKQAPLLFHMATGVDGRVRYVYAFTDLVQLQLYAAATLRQAWIVGPGYRTGAYSEAVITDILFKTGIGLTFGL